MPIKALPSDSTSEPTSIGIDTLNPINREKSKASTADVIAKAPPTAKRIFFQFCDFFGGSSGCPFGDCSVGAGDSDETGVPHCGQNFPSNTAPHFLQVSFWSSFAPQCEQKREPFSQGLPQDGQSNFPSSRAPQPLQKDAPSRFSVLQILQIIASPLCILFFRI